MRELVDSGGADVKTVQSVMRHSDIKLAKLSDVVEVPADHLGGNGKVPLQIGRVGLHLIPFLAAQMGIFADNDGAGLAAGLMAS